MNFLLDLFTNWTFDKVLDYMFLCLLLQFGFYLNPDQSRISIQITSRKDAAIEINISFCDRYRCVYFSR